MAQREVSPPDVRPDLREQRREVVVRAATEDQRPLPDRQMDQQIAAGFDDDSYRPLHNRAMLQDSDAVATRGPAAAASAGRDQLAASQQQHDHAQHNGQRTSTPPREARSRSLPSFPQLLPGQPPALAIRGGLTHATIVATFTHSAFPRAGRTDTTFGPLKNPPPHTMSAVAGRSKREPVAYLTDAGIRFAHAPSCAAIVPPVPYGRLITASCTTGWLDWIHGELWLFPDGLLRVRTSLATTVAHGAWRTVSDEARGREFSDGEIDALVASHKRNVWINADQIERADIHVGITTSRVNMQMRSGRKIKLLWLRGDRAEPTAAHGARFVENRDIGDHRPPTLWRRSPIPAGDVRPVQTRSRTVLVDEQTVAPGKSDRQPAGREG